MAPGYRLEALGYQTILGPVYLLRSFILKPRQTARTSPVVTSSKSVLLDIGDVILATGQDKIVISQSLTVMRHIPSGQETNPV